MEQNVQMLPILCGIFSFMGVLECPGAKVLEDALDRFATKNVDFLDAYLAAQALAMEVPVSTFDKDFRKIPRALSLKLLDRLCAA